MTVFSDAIGSRKVVDTAKVVHACVTRGVAIYNHPRRWDSFSHGV